MRERYLEVLENEISSTKTYHNHKESMAWVATALYIPGILSLSSKLNSDNCLLDVLFAAIILSFGVLVFLFIEQQMNAAEESHYEILGYQRLRWLLITGRIDGLQLSTEPRIAQSKQDPTTEKLSGVMAPQIVHQMIDESRTSEAPRRKLFSDVSLAAVLLSTILAIIWLLNDQFFLLLFWMFFPLHFCSI